MNTLKERLVDELAEAYIDWRETCVRVNDAYRSYAGETGPHRQAALALYTTALDTEQQAAEVYAALVNRAHEIPPSENPPHQPPRGPTPGTRRQ